MSHVTTIASQTDSGAPIDKALMDVGLRQNDDDHETRILALEAGSGAGGGGGEDLGFYGEILGDKRKFSNEGILWRRKFHPLQSTLLNGALPEGFDPESSAKNDRFFFGEDNDNFALWSVYNDAGDTADYDQYYEAYALVLAKNGEINFKLKPGENFFGISGKVSTGAISDNLEILIDGQTPVALGLTDQDDAAAPNAINYSSSVIGFQKNHWFFNLDGKEHNINIKNNDSGTDAAHIDAVTVGYRSDNHALDRTLEVNPGKAKVAGNVVAHDSGTFEFTASSGQGKTSVITCDTSGTLAALEGHEGFMTQVKAEEAIAFSGAVTSLPVKSCLLAEDEGIGLLSTPFGNYHLFSWDSKTTTTVQTNSLDGVLWKSKPNKDYTPLDNFGGTYTEGTGDLNIVGWATAPVVITSSNNKLDFKVIIGGATTTHAATIPDGAYAADLISICDAIEVAMETAKPLDQGVYICKWDENQGLYRIGVDSQDVTELQLPFSSGANQANSIHATLGYPDTDVAGEKFYTSTTERRHKASRYYKEDKNFMWPQDSRMKHHTDPNSSTLAAIDDAEERMGFGSVYWYNSNFSQCTMIYPDEDCCGLSMHFLARYSGSMLRIAIDNGQAIYMPLIQAHMLDEDGNKARVMSTFISFPRGSRTISIHMEESDSLELNSNALNVALIGARQYFSRPACEELSSNTKILKSYDIAPLSQYCTLYGNNVSSVYSVQSSGDNVNSITESGAWSSTTGSVFNKYTRLTTALNAYVDVNVTLQGSGFVFLKTNLANPYTQKAGIFVSASAIVEGTDRVQNVTTYLSATSGNYFFDQNLLSSPWLPAGTYNIRFKNEISGQRLEHSAVGVVDEVAPELHKYTVNDLSNTSQGVAYPINVIKRTVWQDCVDKIPAAFFRSGYREGKAMKGATYSATNGLVTQDYDRSDNMRLQSNFYYGQVARFVAALDEIYFMEFMRSASVQMSNWDTASNIHTNSVTSFLDAKQCPNVFGLHEAVKGGSGPIATRFSEFRPWFKEFWYPCTFSSGTTYTCADTRGITVDSSVRVYDGTALVWGVAVISAVTDNSDFTIKSIPSGITAADVTKVEFNGFHHIRMRSDEARWFPVMAWEFEPLAIRPSRHLVREFPSSTLEQKTLLFKSVATGNDIYYPLHSDGIEGNYHNSTIEIMKKSSGSATWDIPADLRSITISAGTLDIKITSTRMVSTYLDDSEVM